MSERVTAVQEQPQRIPAAAPPRISYRALGISNVFFGLLAGVGALANWSSGKAPERAVVSAVLALTLIVMGILMLKNDPPRRR